MSEHLITSSPSIEYPFAFIKTPYKNKLQVETSTSTTHKSSKTLVGNIGKPYNFQYPTQKKMRDAMPFNINIHPQKKPVWDIYIHPHQCDDPILSENSCPATVAELASVVLMVALWIPSHARVTEFLESLVVVKPRGERSCTWQQVMPDTYGKYTFIHFIPS